MNKKKYYLLIILLLIFLIPLFASCKQKVDEVRTTKETINIQKVKAIDGIDLYLLIDESGSMSGQMGTDKAGLRFDAGKYLIQNLLVKNSDPENPNRVAVIHFGDDATSKGLIDLTLGGVKDLAVAVDSDSKINMGDTSFLRALEKVVLLDSSAPECKNVRNKIIVIFTDGEPDDARHLASIQKYFNEIQLYFKEKMKGFSLYVIGIDNQSSRIKFSDTMPEWKKVAGDNNVHVLRDVKDLYTKFNQTIQQIFELPQIERVTVTKSEDFEVQPYLDKVEFHIFTESNIKLGIRRPDGKLVNVKDNGVSQKTVGRYSILTINSPEPGLWKYEILEGTGSVNILRNPIPFRLQLEYPPSVYPVGKPLMIRAQFTKANGEEVKELPDYPLSFTAKVTSPDYPNYDEDVQFLPKNKINKTYYASLPVKIEKPGEYHIKLKVKGGTRFETSNTQKIFVQSYPYFSFSIPEPLNTYPLCKSMKIEATIRRGKEISDPKKEYQDNPNDLVLVQIVSSSNNQSSPAVWLNYEGKGKYSSIIPFELKEGNYTFAAKVKGEPRLADKMIPTEQIEDFDFFVSPTGGQLTSSIAKMAGMIILTILIIWSIWIVIWLNIFTKKFSGYLNVSIGDEQYIEGYQEFKWLRPITADISGVISDEDSRKKSKKKISFWVKAKGEDTVCVYIGGWVSLFLMGIISKKSSVSKDDGNSELGEYIAIKISQ